MSERAKNFFTDQHQISSDEELYDKAKINYKSINKIDLAKIVQAVVDFAELLSGITLYKYERNFAERIVWSLLLADGETIVAEFARQTGKSQTLAAILPSVTLLFPLLSEYIFKSEEGEIFKKKKNLQVFKKFTRGFWCGVYGPDYDRASIIGNKINFTLLSKEARIILSSEGFDMKFPEKLSNYIGKLPRNSFIKVKSANRRVSVEGETFHLVVIDETQEVSDYVLKKSISPFTASTLGTTVFIGSAYPKRVYFYDIGKMQHERDIEEKHLLKHQNYFRTDYKEAQLYNDNYRIYIEKEKFKLGEASDEFRMCVSPETRVLTADLRHIPASEVFVGLETLGFDENSESYGKMRQFKKSVIEKVWHVKRPCYKLELDDGSAIVCAEKHPFLLPGPGRRIEWILTKDIGVRRYKNQKEDRIFKLTDVWEYTPSFESGYLSAIYDSKGSISQTGIGHLVISFSHSDSIVFSTVKKYLTKYGFKLSEKTQRDDSCKNLFIEGGKSEILRFLGQIRPKRLLEELNIDLLGTIGKHNKRLGGDFNHPKVIKKTFVGEKDVVAFRTSSKTFIAEGFATHNSYELFWPIEKGMLITEDFLITRLGDNYGVSNYDITNDHVIGIDLGKVNDSTVVTVAEVDWENPILIDSNSGIIRYKKKLKNWFEIQGDDYDAQFYMICNFIEHYLWHRLIVDATGVGAPMFDRLYNKYNGKKGKSVKPFVYNKASKSEAYSLLYTELLAERWTFPTAESVRKLRKFQNFVNQMVNLSKTIENGYLVVKPTSETIHDDYCDSLVITNYAIESELTEQEVEEKIENIYRNSRFGRGLFKNSIVDNNFWS